MLRDLRLGVLASARGVGLTTLMRHTAWRNQRLLILCYHGLALDDEHTWNPGLYMRQSVFERRMEFLRRARCNILSLSEGLDRLHGGTLPDRSVAITFDDGWHDFAELALPVLRRFEIPATVYLTTYYVDFNRPVFDTMLRYLLWKAAGANLQLGSIIPEPLHLTGAGIQLATDMIVNYVKGRRLSGAAKDDLLTRLACRVGIDYESLLRRRILHLMDRDEVRQAAEAGIDIQLHTHRHRISYDRELFMREIEDNRRVIRSITGVNPVHFCYPSGAFVSEYREWLPACGVRSATTCEQNLASAAEDPYFLPRVLDSTHITQAEFEAWVSGLPAFLPRRRYAPPPHELVEDWTHPAALTNS